MSIAQQRVFICVCLLSAMTPGMDLNVCPPIFLSLSLSLCLSTLMSNFTLLICGKLNLHRSYSEHNV